MHDTTELYMYASDLFLASGNASTPNLVYCNHTPEQVVYFDSTSELSLSRYQRMVLKYEVSFVSYHFEIGKNVFGDDESIGFYSAELNGTESNRSQLAYEVHQILTDALGNSATVILFRSNHSVLLSMQGFGSGIILSDWYHEKHDFDVLSEKMYAGNMCFHSAKSYFYDFLFSTARWYYLSPITKEIANYYMLPPNYVSSYEFRIEEDLFDREALKERLRTYLRSAEIEYGTDYVEPQLVTQSTGDFITDDIDLMILELETAEELDELESSSFDSQLSGYDSNTDEGPDKYEFDDFDEQIFSDPALMVKFLEKSSYSGEGQFIPPNRKDSFQLSLADFFREFDLEVVDKRKQGGFLWVVGCEEDLYEYIEFAEDEYGVKGNYGTGSAIQDQPGWYTSSTI